MPTRSAIGSLLLLVLACGPAGAESFRAGDVLRATFDLRGLPPLELDTMNVFEFAVGIDPVGPIGHYTTRLFDRGRLVGTYVGADPGTASGIVFSSFKAATSGYTAHDPTVIDFRSFNEGSFDGAVEFSIASGRLANLFRISDDLTIGRSISSSVVFATNINPKSFEIAPVPEPASLLLLIVGAAGVARRCVRRHGVP